MAIKNLLDEVKDALSVAQAGMQGTLKPLEKARSKTKKRTASKSTSMKKAHNSATAKPKAKRKRNPSNLVIKARAAVPRKPSKQQPARKSK